MSEPKLYYVDVNAYTGSQKEGNLKIIAHGHFYIESETQERAEHLGRNLFEKQLNEEVKISARAEELKIEK